MCFTDVAGEFLRVGITSLGLHTWQSVIGASVAHAERNTLLAAAEVSRILSSMEAEGTSPDRMIYEAAISIYVRCEDGDQAIKLYERMQKANLATKLEGGKDPIERMLLDVMDAALVGALALVRLSFYGSLH
jgi:pentatricopeptide repeat protein